MGCWAKHALHWKPKVQTKRLCLARISTPMARWKLRVQKVKRISTPMARQKLKNQQINEQKRFAKVDPIWMIKSAKGYTMLRTLS